MHSKSELLKDKTSISIKLGNDDTKMDTRFQQLNEIFNNAQDTRSGNCTTEPNLSIIDSSKKINSKVLKGGKIMLKKREGALNKRYSADKYGDEGLYCKEDLRSIINMYSRGDQWSRWKDCGQCEENMANVTCHECSEAYCAKCYAKFHLKGSLRKHRSTSISILPNRASMPQTLLSKRAFKRNPIDGSRNNSEAQKTLRSWDSNENNEPNNVERSFAIGNYDEKLSAQYFQDAIMAWRSGNEAPYEPLSPLQRNVTESSTEMDGNYRPFADTIKFTPSLSYSEQLLLRKHRSCQLVPVEMKYILNMMTRSNDAELIENQRLLLANLKLETSVNSPNLNEGVLTDNQDFDIGSLTNLWLTEDVFDVKQRLYEMSSLENSHFDIKELVSSSEDPQTFKIVDCRFNVNNNMTSSTPILETSNESLPLESSFKCHLDLNGNTVRDLSQSNEIISRKENKSHSTSAILDRVSSTSLEISVDSNELENFNNSAVFAKYDKFDFEDSLDFQQRCSNNSENTQDNLCNNTRDTSDSELYDCWDICQYEL